MPIINVVSGTGNTPEALQQRGPVLQISIGVSEALARQLSQSGQEIPAAISGYGIFDSGATMTCIDNDVSSELKLPMIDQITMVSASHATKQGIYAVQIGFIGTTLAVNVGRAIGANLRSLGIVALFGRDMLRHGILVYNGTLGVFSFAV